MYQFAKGACRVLAQDSRTSVADIDRAIGNGATLISTMVSTFEGGRLPARRAQALYERAHRSLGRILEGRGEIVGLMAELIVIQRHSNVAETDFGCATPWNDLFTPTGAKETAPITSLVASAGEES